MSKLSKAFSEQVKSAEDSLFIPEPLGTPAQSFTPTYTEPLGIAPSPAAEPEKPAEPKPSMLPKSVLHRPSPSAERLVQNVPEPQAVEKTLGRAAVCRPKAHRPRRHASLKPRPTLFTPQQAETVTPSAQDELVAGIGRKVLLSESVARLLNYFAEEPHAQSLAPSFYLARGSDIGRQRSKQEAVLDRYRQSPPYRPEIFEHELTVAVKGVIFHTERQSFALRLDRNDQVLREEMASFHRVIGNRWPSRSVTIAQFTRCVGEERWEERDARAFAERVAPLAPQFVTLDSVDLIPFTPSQDAPPAHL